MLATFAVVMTWMQKTYCHGLPPYTLMSRVKSATTATTLISDVSGTLYNRTTLKKEELMQTQLETLYLVKDTDEVWGTYCKECAGTVGEEFGLKWNTYPFMPDSMYAPDDLVLQEDEVEPLVYAPEIFESDCPVACENCDVWLDCSLTNYGVDYLTEFEMPQEVIDLYLGE